MWHQVRCHPNNLWDYCDISWAGKMAIWKSLIKPILWNQLLCGSCLMKHVTHNLVDNLRFDFPVMRRWRVWGIFSKVLFLEINLMLPRHLSEGYLYDDWWQNTDITLNKSNIPRMLWWNLLKKTKGFLKHWCGE